MVVGWTERRRGGRSWGGRSAGWWRTIDEDGRVVVYHIYVRATAVLRLLPTVGRVFHPGRVLSPVNVQSVFA